MAVASTRIKKVGREYLSPGLCKDYLIRLCQETERLLAEPVEGVSATPYEDNERYFNVAIAGPIDSPYQGEPFLAT